MRSISAVEIADGGKGGFIYGLWEAVGTFTVLELKAI